MIDDINIGYTLISYDISIWYTLISYDISIWYTLISYDISIWYTLILLIVAPRLFIFTTDPAWYLKNIEIQSCWLLVVVCLHTTILTQPKLNSLNQSSLVELCLNSNQSHQLLCRYIASTSTLNACKNLDSLSIFAFNFIYF